MHDTKSQECILEKSDMSCLTTLERTFSPLVRLAGTWKPPGFPHALPVS